MKRNSVTTRAWYRRPAIRALVPDLKLLLNVLTTGCETFVGVYIPAGIGDDAGLAPEAVAGGLASLEKAGHIVLDKETGEIFIAAFFRDNKFKLERMRRLVTDEFCLVQSPELKKRVLAAVAASPECCLKVDSLRNHMVSVQGEGEAEGEGEVKKKAAVSSPPSAAAPLNNKKRRHPRRTEHGIECWYPNEDVLADKLEAETQGDELAAAVAGVRAQPNSQGKPSTSPVPQLVKDKLDERKAGRDKAAAEAAQERQEAAAAEATAEQNRTRDAALQAFLTLPLESQSTVLATFAGTLHPQLVKDYRSRGIEAPAVRAALRGYLLKHPPAL